MDTRYEVVTAPACMEHEPEGHEPHANANWSADLGADNEFDSVEEAEAGILALRELGEEFADGYYRVREIGARWPL